MTSTLWNEGWLVSIINHLWQSTLVVLLALLLTWVLKRNQARTRYWVWMVASVKLLVPFSLFVAIGEWFRPAAALQTQSPQFASAIANIAQPFSANSQNIEPVTVHLPEPAVAASSPHHVHLLPALILTVWLCGFLFLLVRWARNWWAIRATVQSASPMPLSTDVPVLSSSLLLEPGVFGIFRPVLLLPEKILNRLSAPQLRSILAHEMCHVRRRDNLTAAIHMVVEAIFWFHPAVWWIGTRLIEERERACDEAVLQLGNEAEVYAQSILNVCKLYTESPMACMSGVTGSDLKRRIVRIMTEQVSLKLDLRRKLLLSAVGIAVVSVPLVFGLLHITDVRAQTASPPSSAPEGQGLAGTWQGMLHSPNNQRAVIKISKDGNGYKALFYNIDMGGAPLTVKTVTLEGSTVRLAAPAIGSTYEGKLSADGVTITGTFTQGAQQPLVLTRATPDAAWAIPAISASMAPIDANVSPSFAVASIRQVAAADSDPMTTRFLDDGVFFRGVPIAWVVQQAFFPQTALFVQDNDLVIGLPSWTKSARYDIKAKVGDEDLRMWKALSLSQRKLTLQSLLVTRFNLQFHNEIHDRPTYSLVVAKNGPKLHKTESGEIYSDSIGARNAKAGSGYSMVTSGKIVLKGASLSVLANLLSSQGLDHAVVDKTGLTGVYDITLQWSPYDIGSSDASLPSLFTALQEQLGLKLEYKKNPIDVIVIDHIERPSAN